MQSTSYLFLIVFLLIDVYDCVLCAVWLLLFIWCPARHIPTNRSMVIYMVWIECWRCTWFLSVFAFYKISSVCVCMCVLLVLRIGRRVLLWTLKMFQWFLAVNKLNLKRANNKKKKYFRTNRSYDEQQNKNKGKMQLKHEQKTISMI